MKAGDVARLLDVAVSTIRTWSAGEFRDYLSPTAQGGTGNTRNFSERDVRLLHLVNIRKQAGYSTADVHAELRELQANDWHDLPALPESPSNVATVPMVPTAAADSAIQSERRSLLREVAALEKRVADLAEQLASEQASRREDVERLLRELSDKERRLSEMETLVKLYEAGRLKPQKDE